MKKIISAKTRIISVITLAVVAIAVIGGAWYFYHQHALNESVVTVDNAPTVPSLPGAGTPPTSYVQEQNKQNAQQVEQAANSNGSAFPTFTRSSFIGSPANFADQSQQQPQACPIDKVVYMFKPNPGSCTVANLKLARQAGVTAEELRCQACSCPALRVAGFTAGELAQTGYSASDLKKCGYSLQDLVDAGFSTADLQQAGFTPQQLRQAGVYVPQQNPNCSVAAIQQQKAQGVSATTLMQQGCGAAALKAAGYSAAAIATAEKAATVCNPKALQRARAQGVSASQLRKDGCGLAALKAAGYTAQDLKDAGFSAKQLKNAGFTAGQLKAAGFSAKQLKNAGFTAGQLKNAGFSAKQLKDAGFTAGQLRKAGFSAAQLKHAGFTPQALLNAGFTKGDLLRAGVSPAALGYDNAQKTAAAQTAATPAAAPTATAAQSTPASTSSIPSISPAYDGGAAADRLQALQQLQQQEMNQQQQADQVQEMQGQMSLQARKLLTDWSNSQSQQMIEGVPVQTASNGAAANGANANADVNTGPTIKAGTVMFATLDTGINSDNNSPILATVLTGKLKGSKLIGNFEREDTKVVLKFTLLSVPSFDKSLPVNIVAIDQNTAHTAISGNVNNHYLLRYGTLFASSFLSGLSQGILSTSSETHCLLGVICQTEPKNSLSTGEYVALGLGNTGQQYANQMGQNFNTPPTIKVPSGTGIGLLFMQDLSLPQPVTTKQTI